MGGNEGGCWFAVAAMCTLLGVVCTALAKIAIDVAKLKQDVKADRKRCDDHRDNGSWAD